MRALPRDVAAFAALTLGTGALLALLGPWGRAPRSPREGVGSEGPREMREITPDDPRWLAWMRNLADDPSEFDPTLREAKADRAIERFTESLKGNPSPGRIHLSLAAICLFRSPPNPVQARYHRNQAVRAGVPPPREIDEGLLAQGISPATLLGVRE
ncbi:MAG: hypothetical protein HY608_11605 [Planctomycetes bacterium]|nr:hypothetical protein [Planctomycetota bacterium]